MRIGRLSSLLILPAAFLCPPLAAAGDSPILLTSGQTTGPDARRLFAAVIGSAPNVGALPAAREAIEVTVQWQAYGAGPVLVRPAERVALNAFEIVSQRPAAGSRVRERNPELSADQVVIVMADDRGRAVAWTAIHDPRIIRAEFPAATGELTGQVFHRAETEFTIDVPVSLDVVQLQVYAPRWTDAGWVLDRLGAVALAPKQ